MLLAGCGSGGSSDRATNRAQALASQAASDRASAEAAVTAAAQTLASAQAVASANASAAAAALAAATQAPTTATVTPSPAPVRAPQPAPHLSQPTSSPAPVTRVRQRSDCNGEILASVKIEESGNRARLVGSAQNGTGFPVDLSYSDPYRVDVFPQSGAEPITLTGLWSGQSSRSGVLAAGASWPILGDWMTLPPIQSNFNDTGPGQPLPYWHDQSLVDYCGTRGPGASHYATFAS